MRIAMVLGGAVTLPYDVTEYTQSHVYHEVVACNEAGVWWKGDLSCWSTLHPEKMRGWLSQRADAGLTTPRIVNVFANRKHRAALVKLEEEYGTKVVQTPINWGKGSGSSGLFALKAAFEVVDCDAAVLCGIPMSPQKNMFRLQSTEWNPRAYRKGWTHIPPDIRSRVRSMSGWTKEQFGYPIDFPVRTLDSPARQC